MNLIAQRGYPTKYDHGQVSGVEVGGADYGPAG